MAKFSSTREVTLKDILRMIRRMAGEYTKDLMGNLRKESTLTTNYTAKDRLKTIRKSMKALLKMESITDLEI